MVENATEAEGCGAMARGAIDERYGMADSLTGRTNTVAGIAPVTHNIRAGVVGEGPQKTCGRMTGTAFRVGIRVGRRGRLAFRHHAVVATSA